MLNVCLICSALLIVKVIFVIIVFFLITVCVSTILANKDDQNWSIRRLSFRLQSYKITLVNDLELVVLAQ